MQDAIFDNTVFGMLAGNLATTGAKTIDYNEVKSVLSNAITLTNTPVGALIGVFAENSDGTNGQEYTLGNPASNATEFSITGKNITFHTSVINGTKIKIYYKVQTAADAKTIKVTSDAFGKSFRVVLDCMVVDYATKKEYKAQINIPTAKFEDSFQFSLSVDGEPAVLDLTMEILKPANSVDMYTMTIFDEDTLV